MPAQSGALQAASPAKPVEITSADGQHMTVSFSDVRNFICQKATDAECKIFLETCKQYRLNPFTKEAYLIHYDNNSEDTPSTIVLGKNCYLQMAERHPSYDGFEAGVIIFDKVAGEYQKREGSIVYEGEELLGGWAKVYRKDRTRPSYEEVKLTEYDTGKSLWKGKKATMIARLPLSMPCGKHSPPPSALSMTRARSMWMLSPPPWSWTRPDRFRLHAGPASRKLLNRPML